MSDLNPDLATIAASLRRIADSIESIDPALYPRQPFVSIDIQPGTTDPDATVTIVDALSMAILGKQGTYKLSIGHYGADGHLPGINSVSVYDVVEPPEKRELKREIEDLRRQRDELAAKVAGGELG